MENIIVISQTISAILVIISALTGLITFTTKKGQGLINKHIFVPIQQPLNEKIDILSQKQVDQDISRCKDYLTEFMADLENGVSKNEVQKQRFFEVYSHYENDLNQNSYVHRKYEELTEKGMI